MSILNKLIDIITEPEDFSGDKIAKQNTGYRNFKAVYATEGEKIAITPWNGEEGQMLMDSSNFKQAFFSLAHNYQTQSNPFYSSVASMVTVLNALRLGRGIVPDENSKSFELFDSNTGEIKEYEFNIYTQENLLDDETDNLVKPRDEIIPKIKKKIGHVNFDKFTSGLALMQVKEILNIYKCRTELYYAHDDMEKGIATFLEHLKECCNSSNKFMITNFYGEIIGLPTGGHYSVIGAYNGKKYGKALVLDSAAHKTPWYWVEIEQLYRAMNSISEKTGNKRGYIIVEDGFY